MTLEQRVNHEGFGVKDKVTFSAKALRWEREERGERTEGRRERGRGEERRQSQRIQELMR